MSQDDNGQENGNENLLPKDNSTQIDMSAALEEITNRMNANIEAMNAGMQQQINNLASSLKPQEPDNEYDYYSDPEKYLAKKEQEIEKRISEKINKTNQSQAAINNAIAEVSRDYPEMVDSSSAFYKEVDKQYSKLSESVKNTPEGIRLAALQAANAIGLQPKSKRNKNEEDFSLSSSGSGSSKKKTTKKEVADATLMWSKMLGRDTDSEEYKKGIEKAISRDYKKYK